MTASGRRALLCLAALFVACAGDRDLAGYRLAVIGGTSQVGDVYVVNGNGRILRRVTDTPDQAEMWPCWSRDGTRIFYESRATSDRRISLHVFDLGNGSDEVLYGPAKPGELWPAISPDGTKLAHVVRDTMFGRMVIKDLESGAVDTVALPGERLIRPEWAPDSRRLLCQRRVPGAESWDLVVVDTQTGERRLLGGASDTTEFKGRWSPDGRYVSFSVAQDAGRGYVGLVAIDVETGSRTVLVKGDDERVVSGSWLANGQLAALRERPLPMAILRWPNPMVPTAFDVRPVRGNFVRGRLAHSPDGRYVALNARGRPGRGRHGWVIVVFDAEGNEVCRWPRRLQMYCPDWAPMGASVVP